MMAAPVQKPLPQKLTTQWYSAARQQYQSTSQKVNAWLSQHTAQLEKLRQTSQQALAAASLAGTIAMQNPSPLPSLEQVRAQVVASAGQSGQVATPAASELNQMSQEEFDSIMAKLDQAVHQAPGHLERSEELYIEQQLSDILGFPVAAELDGNRLNHSLGIMGGEQHLKRFPGDGIDQHDAYQESGIAPNRGAFGWFTDQGQLTAEAIQREKYYFAVQTLYLPNWNTDHPYLKEWYKFRKMVVVNPAEKVAVVGVVGDAGPALWVKKQFGGSPEVIREGRIWSKASRGRVLLYFVDDPANQIPLGPINLEAPNLES